MLVEQRYAALLEVLNGASSVSEPERRRKGRGDYKRWERSRSMELWQMDIVGGVRLADGQSASIVSGIDDHLRFVVCAQVVARATARPVCDALAIAMRAYGVPDQVLTDNGKVFTGRFGPGTGEVLFDRICRENGIGHLLTAPRSPTTTGKVDRWHKTLRGEFLDGKVFASSKRRRRSYLYSYLQLKQATERVASGGSEPWLRSSACRCAPSRRSHGTSRMQGGSS